MNKELLTLITEMDELEKIFHDDGEAPFTGISIITDVEKFREWKDKLIDQLTNFQIDKSSKDKALEILKKNWGGYHDKRYFNELKKELLELIGEIQ